MIEKRVSIRYARALMTAAKDMNKIEEVYQDLILINSIFESSKEFIAVFRSPVVPNSKKRKLIKEIFENRITDLTFSVIDLIISKNRENLMFSIYKEFEGLYFEFKNMIPIDITTAVEIDDNTRNNVLQKLNEITGKSIVPNFIIDSKIKGGIKVKIDTWVYDASIENKLHQLYQKLTVGV